jgi:hypothetical protein
METNNDQLEISEPSRKSAETYYQSLRAELVERVKLRDQILITYLGAIAALIGFALGPSAQLNAQHSAISLLSALLVLVPVLSLGAASMICHHQEIMSVFTEYIANELNQWMCTFPIYDRSEQRRKFGSRAERHILTSQLPLLCGPWVLIIVLNWPVPLWPMNLKEILLILGLIPEYICVRRLISSRNFRRRVLKDIYKTM